MIAKGRRPHGEGLYRLAVLGNLRFNGNYVTVAELKRLADADVARGVFVGQLAGRCDAAGCAANVERRINLVAQVFVVGVKAKRKPKFFRLQIDQVEGMAFLVLVFL